LKRDSIYVIVAGMILTLLVWLMVVEIIWPANVTLYFIPISIFIITLWLNAWRVTRMKQKTLTG
jgi:hypothetical protein